MTKLIQIKLPAHEKLVIDRLAKSEGFRSSASFAYYALRQQMKRIQKEEFNFEPNKKQQRDLEKSLDQADEGKFDKKFDISRI